VKSHKPRAEEQFKFEVNELSWNNDGDLFFLTSGQGSIHILRSLLCVKIIIISITKKQLHCLNDGRMPARYLLPSELASDVAL